MQLFSVKMQFFLICLYNVKKFSLPEEKWNDFVVGVRFVTDVSETVWNVLKSTSPLLSFGKHSVAACQVSAFFFFIIQTKLGVWAIITIHPEVERTMEEVGRKRSGAPSGALAYSR